MKKKVIYVSGKITGTSDYAERFSAVEDKLIAEGYEVLNPVRAGKWLEHYLAPEKPKRRKPAAGFYRRNWQHLGGVKMKNAQIYINGVPIKKATGISLLLRRSLWQKIKDKINFYKGRRKSRRKLTCTIDL